MTEYNLGDKVSFTQRLIRRGKFERHGIYSVDQRVWEKDPPTFMLKYGTEKQGIVVGVRTLSEGEVDYGNGYDTGTEYTATKWFPAVLVAFDIRCKPVFVLPEDLQLLSVEDPEELPVVEAPKKEDGQWHYPLRRGI